MHCYRRVVRKDTEQPGRGRSIGLALFALVFVALVTTGARGSFGLFVTPWETEFDASRALVSLIPAVGFIALGLGQPTAGWLSERASPRSLLLAGLVVSFAGFLAGAFLPNVLAAIVLVGAVACFGTAFASQTVLSVIGARMFREGHGKLFGLISAAAAGGQIVVLPVTALVLAISLEAAITGLAVLMVVSAAVVLVAVPRMLTRSTGGAHLGGEPASLRMILAEPRFWLLTGPYFVCGVTSTGLVDPHLIPYMVGHHISNGTASAITATLAAFNVAGVLAAGVLTDRVNPARLLAAVYLQRAATLFVLPLLTTPEMLVPFALLYGIADFASVPPTTELLRRTFPAGGWGLALGLASGAHQLGSAAGAFAGGWLYDLTGGYAAFFVAAAVSLLLASAMSVTVRARSVPVTA